MHYCTSIWRSIDTRKFIKLSRPSSALIIFISRVNIAASLMNLVESLGFQFRPNYTRRNVGKAPFLSRLIVTRKTEHMLLNAASHVARVYSQTYAFIDFMLCVWYHHKCRLRDLGLQYSVLCIFDYSSRSTEFSPTSLGFRAVRLLKDSIISMHIVRVRYEKYTCLKTASFSWLTTHTDPTNQLH